jgi:hypothetical protein
MTMSDWRLLDVMIAAKRVPTQIGPSVSFSARASCGLSVGPLRWSAT